MDASIHFFSQWTGTDKSPIQKSTVYKVLCEKYRKYVFCHNSRSPDFHFLSAIITMFATWEILSDLRFLQQWLWKVLSSGI
jgi:hypothetical protein